jgi:hypothetical protein
MPPRVEAMPEPAEVLVRVTFGQDPRQTLFARAQIALDGAVYTATVAVPAGATWSTDRKERRDGWLFSTAARAVGDALTAGLKAREALALALANESRPKLGRPPLRSIE